MIKSYFKLLELYDIMKVPLSLDVKFKNISEFKEGLKLRKKGRESKKYVSYINDLKYYYKFEKDVYTVKINGISRNCHRIVFFIPTGSNGIFILGKKLVIHWFSHFSWEYFNIEKFNFSGPKHVNYFRNIKDNESIESTPNIFLS